MKSACLLAIALCISPALAAANLCRDLKIHIVSATDIGLPTRGAALTSAKLTTSSHTSFCKVLGQIHSVDPAAQPIRFELNLPANWNQKALQYGGGAFDGYLQTGLGPTVVGDKHQPTPLERGYVTFGSDSGHHHHYLLLPDILNALNAKFALNDEQRKNFASDQLKKTHDTAVALMKLYYSAPPQRMYFIGGSTGGREAMKVVDRWPTDYDGVVAAYAAWNQIESDLQFIRVSQAMYAKAPGGQSGWLSPAKTKLLRDAVLQACDAQDGLADGIISNPDGCHFDDAQLRCLDGKDHKGCLSDAQQKTVSAFFTPQISDFQVDSGLNFEPGFNTLRGADLVGNLGIVRHPFPTPIPLLNSFYYLVGSGVLRYFLTRDPHFDALTFDPKTGGPGGKYIPGILQQSVEDDASLAGLTPFEQHGGKLLLLHGTADATIPTGASVLLYQRIVAAMGQARTGEFVRLYLIPGFGHGQGTFNAGFDTVGVLDAWADGHHAPAQLTVDDQNKDAHRTRPLCLYPAWPRYQGGDTNFASSFTCRQPTP